MHTVICRGTAARRRRWLGCFVNWLKTAAPARMIHSPGISARIPVSMSASDSLNKRRGDAGSECGERVFDEDQQHFRVVDNDDFLAGLEVLLRRRLGKSG